MDQYRQLLIKYLAYLQLLLAKKKMENFNQQLYQLSLATVGTDASPIDYADDGVGCAESVSTLINRLDPSFPIITGTYTLLLKFIERWKEIDGPLPGRVAICATGTGNGTISGHVAICGENGLMYSNSSLPPNKGKWMQNYNTKTWHDRYEVYGGFKTHYFERG